uniref:Transcription termination factor, mitochondrial n=1 Tax=Heliothis virescens TaxID=7102 RepID=A0A2A4JB43_HELVI
MILRSLFSVLSLSSNNLTSNVYKVTSPTTWKSILKISPCNIYIRTITVSTASYKSRTRTKLKSDFDSSKARIVLGLNFQSPEDAVPFYKLPVKTLVHIHNTTKEDVKKGFCKNRLYYISSRLKVPPSIVTEKLAKRTFIYSLSFDWIEKALDVLLEMNVSADRILRDLWVLKYHHETIYERLQRVKSMGVENLYPWMVRCSEDILNRFLAISQETKDILGDSVSKQTYLANRLNVSPDTIQDMCLKIPALKAIRVTKVKHFLDFLIAEGFDVEEIASKPRVLSASQKTVKLRLDRLRELGLNQINLNVLCRSKKDFKKYCESIESLSKEGETTAKG